MFDKLYYYLSNLLVSLFVNKFTIKILFLADFNLIYF